MSNSRYFGNKRGRFVTYPLANQFQPNSPTTSMHPLPQTPVMYSQSHLTRNQLNESAPLSEYSEVSMPFTRAIPSPFQQRAHHPNPCEPNLRPYRRVHHDVMASPYTTPSQLLPPPTPQYFVTNYNPDQSFVMHSTPSRSASQTSMVLKKTATSFSPISAKINNVASKNTSQGSKMNSMNRKRFFIGSIDQVVHWHKMAKEAQLYTVYEVSAILESLSSNALGVYRMILRSDENTTSKHLQAVFYQIDRDLPKVKQGQLITCVGRMVGSKKLQVFDMWPSTKESLAGLKRVSFLCQRTLQEAYLGASEP